MQFVRQQTFWKLTKEIDSFIKLDFLSPPPTLRFKWCFLSVEMCSRGVFVWIYHNCKAKAPVCSRSSFIAPEQVKGAVYWDLIIIIHQKVFIFLKNDIVQQILKPSLSNKTTFLNICVYFSGLVIFIKSCVFEPVWN